MEDEKPKWYLIMAQALIGSTLLYCAVGVILYYEYPKLRPEANRDVQTILHSVESPFAAYAK